MSLSEELQWRGFVNQTTITDLTILDRDKPAFYHGFDASADSLTVGNLAGTMFDKVFMRHGCKAVILAGGATSLIGDPGGKVSERQLQDEETISNNVSKVASQLTKIYAGHDFTLVNNLDWTKDLSVLHFLRDIGKHFSMTPLVQRDFIARRLGEDGSGISYTEFSYTLLQGLDFQHLYDKYGVTLQIGSSDQWGNCLSGIDLIRRTRNAEVHVLTQPLVINKATGVKFGKSEGGAVWLDTAKTSPTQFYQFWVNIDDGEVEGHLKVYTELGRQEIEEIMSTHKLDPKKRYAQKRLAQEVTKIVHGDEQMHVAEQLTRVLINEISVGDMTELEIDEMRNELSSTKAEVGNSLVDVIVRCGLASSNSEARQLINNNAIYINNKAIVNQIIQNTDFQNGRLLIRKGKVFKNTALVELS